MPADATDHWEYTLHVPHDALAIGVARSTLHAVLVRHGQAAMLDTAGLLASELLTNAYLHSEGPASLRMRWTDDVLRLGVWDSDPRPPEQLPMGPMPADEAQSGRGLLLVAVYADDWGWFLLGDDAFGPNGKFVWCDLRSPKARTREAWGTAA